MNIQEKDSYIAYENPVCSRLHRLRAYMREEIAAQSGSLFLWAPVFVAFGIGVYFLLPSEPPIVLGLFFLCLTGFGFVLTEPLSRVRLILLGAVLMSTGFLAGQVRTHRAHTPIIAHEIGPVDVQGTIAALEDLGAEQGARIVLSNVEIEDLSAEETPRKIRLKLRDDTGVRVGQRLKILAHLHPPSPPVAPGGFDFQRHLYFQGIGAVGFVYKTLGQGEHIPYAGWRNGVEYMRQTIGFVIENSLSHPQASIAMALMIGRKTAMMEDDQEAMRAAGLAHMLAISGLHVGLFSGFVFFVLRFGMAAVPALALRYPIKKVAAVIALAAAVIYMMLAGSTIPTQRAILMTGIVFLAIILDRSPISLRLVAFAAIAVLLIFPESLLSASFQMSFSAVTALVVFYDALRPIWSAWHRRSGFVKRLGLYFMGVCFTSLVAGLATAPFALFHFQQIAVYGLLGNLMAAPVMAFVIMPSVVGALVLMPVGLSFLPFVLMDAGITAVLDMAWWVEGLPHAVLKVQAWPLSALGFLAMGSLFMMLWYGRLRWLGVLPLCICVIIVCSHVQNDILISSDFKVIQVRDESGVLYISDRRSNRFARENWAQMYGVDPNEVERFPAEGGTDSMRCDEQGCRMLLNSAVISYLKSPLGRMKSCAESDLVFAPFPLKGCGAPYTIDVYDTKQGGAYGILVERDGFIKIQDVGSLRGRRPWTSGVLYLQRQKRTGSEL